MKTKYKYLKVIQSRFGIGWDDESIYFTDSQGRFLNSEERTLFKHDLKEYRLATGNRIRVINRREANESWNTHLLNVLEGAIYPLLKSRRIVKSLLFRSSKKFFHSMMKVFTNLMRTLLSSFANFLEKKYWQQPQDLIIIKASTMGKVLSHLMRANGKSFQPERKWKQKSN